MENKAYRPEDEQPNFEDIHNVLKAVTRTEGVRYDVIKEWFTACKIIDGRRVSIEFFDKCYVRIVSSKGDLSLANLGQLLGIESVTEHHGNRLATVILKGGLLGDMKFGYGLGVLAMISRDTHQNLQEICDRFESVKPFIVSDIQEGLRRDGIKYNSQ